jgi:curved DNA-binding protein CbpA
MRVRTERDYYAILGVAQGATDDELKQAYRRLALQHHPDRNPGDRRAEERFKEISEAYAVLMDPRRRTEYDRLRQARAGGARPRGPRWREEDLFRDLFTDPRSVSIFDELSREWTRLGLRYDGAFLRGVFFRGQGVIVVGPGGIRWIGTFRGRAPAERVAEGGAVGGAASRETVWPLPGLLRWARERVAAPWRALKRTLALGAGGRSRGDLSYEIALAAEELDRGGRYRITLQRADRTEELLVRVPAGTRVGTRLRLRGKGEARRDGTTGDLYLFVRPRS